MVKNGEQGDVAQIIPHERQVQESQFRESLRRCTRITANRLQVR